MIPVKHYFAYCYQHEQQIPFHVTEVEMVECHDPQTLVAYKTEEALKKCPGCQTKKEYASSRWPEGAEI